MQVLLDIYDPLYLNIIIYRNDNQNINLYISHTHKRTLSRPDLASNPLLALKLLDNQFAKELKEYISSKVPQYMIPQYYIMLEKLPLTINGKIDKKALPDVDFTNEISYVAPRNELESRMCVIWSDVLGVPEDIVSITDDFFMLGGDSILAIRLVNKLNKDIHTNVSVSAIFKHSTVEQLVSYLEHSNEDSIVIEKVNVTKLEEQKLSFAQERLWFIEKYESGTNAYNVPMVFKLSVDIKLNALENSLKSIVSRHEVLRTVIKEDSTGSGYQLVLNKPLEILKISVVQSQLDQELAKAVNHIYALSTEYPIKVHLYEVKDIGTKYLSIVIHHIAFDGWSADIFLKELQEYYQYHLNQSEGIKTNLELPELGIQYKDFALWQRNYLSQERLKKQLDYWKGKLANYETLNLTTDRVRPSQIDYTGRDIYFEVDALTTERLRQLAKELQVSMYSLLLSGYYLMLRVYSNQGDIVVGTPVANRHYPQIEDIIGFFVNTLALRVQIEMKASVKEFIQAISKEVIGAQLHQDLPFEKLVEELDLVKDTSRHPIFQVMFGLESFWSAGDQTNLHRTRVDTLVNLLESYIPDVSLYNIAKFDISTFIDDSQSTLKGSFNYAVSLYNENTVSRFIKTYTVILQQLGKLAGNTQKQEQTKLSDLNYIDQEQYNQIIHTWNDTNKEYPHNKTIQELFEEQVEKTPDSIAVVYGEIKLTYGELNTRANQLANYLLERYEISFDTLIVLCLDRSEHMLISILAVLKAGAAYVPIDPSYPDERIKYILSDTSAGVVITNELYKQKLEALITTEVVASAVLAIDNKYMQQQLSLCSLVNPCKSVTSSSLAYVIYTSGTTGNPKGVMVEHKGVVNLKYCLSSQYKLGKNGEEIILQFANYVFDASVEQIVLSLLNGYVLVLIPNLLWSNRNEFYYYLNKNKVTHIDATPSFLALNNFSSISNLKRLIIGGEQLSKDYYNKINLLGNSNIINIYGPTETSITSTVHIIRNGNLSIGSPISNTTCYVLDSNLAPLPIGAVGELYIGGVGLARGYLNRPTLTSESFIANPFQTDEEKADTSYGIAGKNARLYKTGDLVRWLLDGNLEYIGRNDFQVKIRGYRIELGEIEGVLSSYKGVTQSVVVVKERGIDNDGGESGGKYLVGYYVSGDKLDEEEILSYLHTKLPEYMVPGILVYLEQLPLTINGKLDRKSLPDPEFRGFDSYVMPRNELERQVCKIWSEVLGLTEEKVGIRDDFFRLGGDSIISIQLVSRLRQKLKLNVSVKDIFSYKTIERLYDNILSKSQEDQLDFITEQGVLSGEVPLLPIQEWFFESSQVVPDHWNQSFMVKVPDLDIDRLRLSVTKLVEYHDSFRLRYKKVKGQETSSSSHNNYTQYYDSNAKAEELRILDLGTLAKEGSKEFKVQLQKILTDWQSEFDLEQGPTYSIGYVYGYRDGSARIYFALHHLVVDTVSWRILLEDLKTLYEGKSLGLKGSSYRQWVDVVRCYKEKHTEEVVYWDHILSDFNDISKVDSLVLGEDINISLSLSLENTQKLLQEANRTYNTQVNDLLLTAFGYALSKVTGSLVNHIVLEGHGREEIDSGIDITRTLGWFTTMYPVRLEVSKDIGDSIKNVKENLRRVPNKGVGYGALIGYYKSNLPKISFNYLGQFDKESGTGNITKVINDWSIVDEDSGLSIHSSNKDQMIINVNGLVINGSLQFSIGSKLDIEITTELVEIFKQRLEEIIKHTTNQNRSYLTASDIDNIISQECLDRLQQLKEISGVYLANSLQQGFIYHALNQGDIDDAYKVQLIWQYNNKLDEKRLKEAWSYAQKKYSSLRLRLDWTEELVQVIDKEGKLDWRYIDISEENPIIQEQKIKYIREEDRNEVYNLEHGNLFRIYLIKQREDQYTCIFSNHHAILDGWSGPVLLGYVHETYLKLGVKESISLEIDPSYQIAQGYLQKHKNDNKEYWDKYVSHIGDRIDLSGLYKSKVRLSEYKYITQPEEQELRIDGNLYSDLKELNQKEGVTLNAILQYTWHKVLSIYGNSNQTVVGTTVSGRNLPVDNIESSVGLYINTLPLIVDHNDRNIIELIRSIQDNINEINSRSDQSLARLQKDRNGERLFDSLFVYENYPVPVTNDRGDGLRITFQESVEKLDYPLGVIAYEENNQLTFKLRYAGELFSRDSIDQLLVMTRTLLEQIVSHFIQKASSLNYLSQEQYNQIIHTWNDTNKEYPHNKTIQELFEEQVEKTPDSIAVVYGEIKLTYGELNTRANQLANYLLERYEISFDTLIVLCLDRSEHMLISILAVLKAGAAYVPIDPSYPDERIKYILSDTSAGVVITNELYKQKLEALITTEVVASAVLAIDNKYMQQQLSLCSLVNPCKSVTSSSLAYVIYTSGTTGNPKGVMVEHKGVVNLKYCLSSQYKLGKNGEEIILQFANYVFDASVEQIVLSLLNGYVLVLIPNLLWSNRNEFYYYLNKNKVTHIHVTPTFLDLHNFSTVSNLKRLITGGERLNNNCYSKVKLSSANNIQIINTYGPTETSITSTVHIIRNGNLSIGSPISNTTCYVLDSNLAPLPIGAVGELYIGGVGLARGYLNRPTLTSESFIANPFQTDEEKADTSYGIAGKNARLYKTGDLVRWLLDGNLEYIGRNDFQVKIRGYRIELGEIEGVLSSYKGVTQSVVVVKERGIDNDGGESGGKYLVGYYVKDLYLKDSDVVDFIGEWETLYQSEYTVLDLNNFKQNIKGWNSSYTGKAIDGEDILEWINSTVDRINQLKPKVILEIGSGSGLILFNIIDNCDYYYATDFSKNAIAYTNKVINKFGYSNKVITLSCNANELPLHKLKKSYDTVIINSVIQYFPNLDYLESVINKIILNIKNDCQIFIGDVRDYRLLKCFHYSVQSYKNKNISKAKVDYFARIDGELLVSPEYFIYLKTTNKVISHVEIMPKLGKANNEMNNYRYDVILHINKGNQDTKKHNAIYIDESYFINILDFENYFTKNIGSDRLYIRYPNKRIVQDYIGYNKLYNNEIKIDESSYKNILSINIIKEKLENQNYKCKFLLDIYDPLYLNIIIYRNDNQNINLYISHTHKRTLSRPDLASNPLLALKLLDNQFAKELKEYISSKVPQYMIPQYYIMLEKLPLTINGKIDKKALPDVDFTNEISYVAPRNELESRMCVIWSDVLGVPEDIVSITDDFFMLGGDSILAIRLVNKLNKDIHTNVSVSAIFKHSTVEQLVSYLEHSNEDSIVIEKVNVTKLEEQKLSFAQERLWFIEKYESGTNAYNVPMVFKLSVDIKLNALENSLKSIVSRHEVLRTVIKEDSTGSGYQLVLNKPLEILKISVVQSQLDQELAKAVNHIYALSTEYPIKVHLYEVKDIGTKYLSIVIHHIAFDGWSADIFLKELQEYYQYHLNQSEGIKTNLELPELGIQYKDFALWQRNYLSQERLKKQLDYWKGKLANYETLNLTTDRVRPSQIDYTGRDIYFEVDALTTERLRQLAKELQVSMYSLLLSGYYLMLRVYSNQGDIVVGTPVANRHYPQIEDIIGFFVNTLALRVQIEMKASVKEFIQAISKEVIGAQLHQDLPFEKLVEELDLVKDTSRHPIFQVMFGLESFWSAGDQTNLHRTRVDTLVNLLESYIPDVSLYNIAKFDISTFIDDSQSTLKGSFNYAVSLYNENTVSRFIKTYTVILQQLGKLAGNTQKQEQTKLSDLNYIDQEQYNQIIHTWNDTNKEYPHNKTIQELFEEQVEKTPDSIAVVYGEIKLTYGELNTRANQLANYLLERYEISFDTLIVLCLDRSEHMLISILAVLKAGAAYVPIDPSYPDERIKYILSDTSAGVVITNELYKQKLEALITTEVVASAVLAIDNKYMQQQLSLCSLVNPCKSVTSSSLAYVIYTSGTTGNPKGVMVEHKGVVNLKYCLSSQYKLGKNGEEIILQFANYVFDASVEQIVLSLLNGYVLVLIPNLLWSNRNEFYYYLNKNKVTHIDATPSFLALNNFSSISNLKRLIIGGEQLSKDYYNKINLLGNSNIINIYGPTETSITSTVHIIRNGNLSIGSPISNTTCYVLDSNLAPLPIGAVGELYIGGVGLARGYLNRPTLTSESFIANPFQTDEEKADTSYGIAGKNARLYKTGDLVRWLLDGNLEYIGRNDFQVKIRGYRIELGEIEGVLSSYKGVTQSVVVVKERGIDNDGGESGGKYLVGYYVSGDKLDEEEILSYLHTKLPEYMVPGILVYLEQLPLTINGKLDRKSLPDPEFRGFDSYVMPRNELERQVCKIWSEVLGLTEEKVGIRDDFFRLGGDSIISIQLVSRLRQKLKLNVSVKDIFSYKTIERLYDNILSKSQEDQLDFITEQGVLSGEVPLLPIQEWFFESSQVVPDHWNQSFMVKVPDLDIDRLRLSVTKLVEYHDSFRLRYKKVKGQETSSSSHNNYTQYYDSNAKAEELRILDLGTLAKEGSKEFKVQLQKILTDWQSEFDLEQGPTYSIGYVYGYRDGSARIYFALHHLVVDTVSWRILLEDLKTLYEGKSLGLKGSSYRQWVDVVRCYKEKHTEEVVYWDHILSDFNDISKVDSLVLGEDINISLSLSLENTQKLLQEANRTYNTQVNDLLLTAFGYALSKVTGSLVNHIVLEGHGREEIDSGIDITRTLGWFTTMYPVRLEVSKDIGDSIKNVKENLRRVPNKGVGYGALIGYYKSNLPKISFNYLGQFDKESGTGNITKVINDWSIVDEDSGLSIHSSNKDQMIINVNGLVINGSLQFSIGSKLDIEITTELVEIFKQRLEEIIKHTTNQNRSYLTASDIDNIISQECLDRLQQLKEISGVYLANSLQQGFIYHALNQGDIDDAYKVQLIWQYNNKLDEKRLKEAWSYAQKKYSSLRLRLDWTEELVQVIDKEGKLDWRYIDISEENPIIQEQKIKYIREEDRNEVYNLEHGNLFRIYLIKQREDQYTCIFSNHHAILDGWSGPVLLGYVHETYLKLGVKESISLEIDPSYQIAQGYLQKHKNDNKEYWDKYVSHIGDRIDLSGLYKSKVRLSEYKYITQPEEQELRIDGNLYSDLKELNQKEGVTLNAILQYTWHKVLSIYGNSNQTVVGTTVSGRNLPVDNIESSVGLYINTLPLIVDHNDRNIIELIRSIQDNINEINSRSDQSLARLQKDRNGERLFDSLFVYENYPVPVTNDRGDGLRITFQESVEKLDYPLGVIAYEENNQLTFKLRYAGELFSRDSIDQLLVMTRTLLEQIVSHFIQKASSLNYLSQEQYNQIIHTWNDTNKEYPHNKTIQELFEEQVEKTPDSIAVVYGEIKLTYGELNTRANQLANYLLERYEISFDTLIVLCLDRSEHMLISILAVLKAGAAYVPIDPSYPDERIKYILSDTSAGVVITNELYKQKLEALITTEVVASAVLAIDNKYMQQQLSLCSLVNPCKSVTSSSLAYVIYTSGTTGNPKGVMVEHKGVVNLKYCLSSQYKLGKNGEEIILQFANYVFDASVEQIVLSLLNGYVLVLIPNLLWSNRNEFYYYLNKNKVTHIHVTPTFLDLHNFSTVSNLKRLITGGERLNNNCYSKVKLSSANNIQIINTYGPTETSITSTVHIIRNGNLSIGSPISNTTCYVLDSNLAPLPIGAVGELYIGGVGLARGYLNRPTLTSESFIANPFQTDEEKADTSYGIAGKNARLYKTGDLVRWLLDGNLEYIGRNDFQVKIRGYRIELGEIEGVLSSYKGVTQSVVVVKERGIDNDGGESGGKYLVGYYVKDLYLKDSDVVDFIGEWETLYQSEYTVLDLNNFKQNIKGWNSSYTGKAIDGEDILEWINSTVDRINQLKPKVILEIGSGSGLILFNIIDNCDYYYATDFSKNAIAYTNKVINKFGYSNKVITLSCNANELPLHKLKKSYDTVIINSVIQYFPNLDYLESVINKIILNIKNDCQIFIGDVRDYRLLKCFHYSVQSYKNKNISKAKVDYFARIDGELLVSPEYFIYLKTTNKVISHVEIMPKLGKANNEMNNYRYDVILHINKGNQDTKKHNAIYIDESYFINILDFENYFTKNIGSDRLYKVSK